MGISLWQTQKILLCCQSEGFHNGVGLEDAAWTFEKLLETNIAIGALFDRDYMPKEEVDLFLKKMRKTVPSTFVLERKEIENYLLNPSVLVRAINQRLEQSGRNSNCSEKSALTLLKRALDHFKPVVSSQISSQRARFFRSKVDPSTAIGEGLEYVDKRWRTLEGRVCLAPGKLVFSKLNQELQKAHGVSVTPLQVAALLRAADVPEDLKSILQAFQELSQY